MTDALKALKVKCPIGSMVASTGTWTRLTNSGIPYLSKAAAAETSLVLIPIPALQRDGQFGAKLTKLKIPVRVATANLVSTPTVTLYKRHMLAVVGAGTDQTASSITCTVTGATLTLAATDRLINVEVTTPALDHAATGDDDYVAVLRLKAATTSAIRVYDAIAFWQPVI